MRNKRLVNNRKGFTLVEMLVALSISALLFVMAIPTIGALQDLLQKRKFEAYKDVVRSASKLYAKSYKEDLEVNLDGDLDNGFQENKEGDDKYVNITLPTLVNKKLIDDYNDKNITCRDTITKVIESGNKNKYCVMLRCKEEGTSNYSYISLDSDDYCKVDFTAPKLTVTLYKGIKPETLDYITSTTAGGNKNEPNANGSLYGNTKWLNSNLTLNMKAEDGNLLSIKLKNGSGGVESASGDGVDDFSYNIESSKQMNLKDWYVIATDTAGNTSRINLNFGVDTVQPTCTFSDRGKAYANIDGASIKANCTDSTSGIASQTDNITGIKNNVVYTVKDNAGNENSYTLPIIKTYVTKTRSCTAGKSCQAAGCQTYNSCATSACGIASYKTCQNAACGIASYKSCENKSCGVASYKSCRNSSCSCATYNSCSTSACDNASCTSSSCCGSTTSYRKTSCSTYSGFASQKACTNKSTSCGSGSVGSRVRDGGCTYVKKGMYKATMCTCTKSTYPKSCTKSCCGYNTCRTSACGCQTRNSCRDSSCGVESYKSCRLEVCGVESYNSCANAACGANYNTCANSECGCASYYRSTATCGCESWGGWSSYTQTDTCAPGTYNSNANERQCTDAYYY